MMDKKFKAIDESEVISQTVKAKEAAYFQFEFCEEERMLVIS